MASLSAESCGAAATREGLTGSGIIAGIVVTGDADAADPARARDLRRQALLRGDDHHERCGALACVRLPTARFSVIATRKRDRHSYGAAGGARNGGAGHERQKDRNRPAVPGGADRRNDSRPQQTAAGAACADAMRSRTETAARATGSPTTDDKGVYQSTVDWRQGTHHRRVGPPGPSASRSRSSHGGSGRSPAVSTPATTQADPRERSVTLRPPTIPHANPSQASATGASAAASTSRCSSRPRPKSKAQSLFRREERRQVCRST